MINTDKAALAWCYTLKPYLKEWFSYASDLSKDSKRFSTFMSHLRHPQTLGYQRREDGMMDSRQHSINQGNPVENKHGKTRKRNG